MKKTKKLCAILLTGSLLFNHGMVANAALPYPLDANNGSVKFLFNLKALQLQEIIPSFLELHNLSAEERTTLNKILSGINNEYSEFEKMIHELYAEVPGKKDKDAANEEFWDKMQKMRKKVDKLVFKGETVIAAVKNRFTRDSLQMPPNSQVTYDTGSQQSLNFRSSFGSSRYTKKQPE